MAVLLFLLLCAAKLSYGAPPTDIPMKTVSKVNPNKCTTPSLTPSCDSYLYVIPGGLSPSEAADLYSSDAARIENITRHTGRVDYLVDVTCMCKDAGNGTAAYFHETRYTVRSGDTADTVTRDVFSWLAWNVTQTLVAGDTVTVLLPCGCAGKNETVIASYSVENGDTLSTISQLLGSDVEEIERMNQEMITNPEFLNPGWVLFVPMERNAPRPPQQPPLQRAKKEKTGLAVGVSLSIFFLLVGGLILFYKCRNQSHKENTKAPSAVIEKVRNPTSIAALESQYLYHKKDEDAVTFGSDRPFMFSLRDIEEATEKCNESRKIGEGGYGCVYHGILGHQEVAIKKMKSNKSKEFFAELKVLCKVHHINVVELIGYASGEDNLYLVYEYIQNGSLSDHLHDPLLKGHQPLSWNARAQIALDSAKGIEYIHDHTKARYVHRDIKTSNILLDNGFRAKVADFGLVKLVERSNEDEFLATRLVGTPGYLPPEAVRELQMSTKTDVFAFGVVLAELITGCRALLRDNMQPTRLRSLVSIMNGVFQEEDPQRALEDIIDGNLQDSYPLDEAYKMAAISVWCLNEDPMDRPEMREITMRLNQITVATIQWEASLGGNSQVFSGMFDGR